MMARLAFPVCLAGVLAACSPSESPPADTMVKEAAIPIVTGRTSPGAVVTLEPSADAPLPEGNAVLDQFSKAFVPENLFVRVGQPVVFKNSEDQLHNVTVMRSRTGRTVFNVSQNQGDVHTHTFLEPGEYDVSCDVHPGMRAVIVATTSPYAMYADPRGVFEFRNVPPGQYVVRISTGGRVTERTVQVGSGRVDLGEVRGGSS